MGSFVKRGWFTPYRGGYKLRVDIESWLITSIISRASPCSEPKCQKWRHFFWKFSWILHLGKEVRATAAMIGKTSPDWTTQDLIGNLFPIRFFPPEWTFLIACLDLIPHPTIKIRKRQRKKCLSSIFFSINGFYLFNGNIVNFLNYCLELYLFPYSFLRRKKKSSRY